MTSELQMKTFPPPGGHVYNKPGRFSNTSKISLKQMFRPSFREDWTINVNFRVFTSTTLLTKFHKDMTINAASRVLTNFDAARSMTKKGDPKGSPITHCA
ncbi:hypothetical protein DPMN_011037 [Dreissena polymorpha]|uniref:Uncharacterized protein n=1 Tax=Dreissena polymorpha TaxID=45954 RepID=A0A9D4S1H1_DREPO|nr:hypothetical protein DPMN_011037 [Dreissena polymorpha]